MIAQYADVTVTEAARLLAAYARLHRVRLTNTARALTSRTLDPAVILGAEARPSNGPDPLGSCR